MINTRTTSSKAILRIRQLPIQINLSYSVYLGESGICGEYGLCCLPGESGDLGDTGGSSDYGDLGESGG